jgi:hypothetical protein
MEMKRTKVEIELKCGATIEGYIPLKNTVEEPDKIAKGLMMKDSMAVMILDNGEEGVFLKETTYIVPNDEVAYLSLREVDTNDE